jgi:hypothetical protein
VEAEGCMEVETLKGKIGGGVLMPGSDPFDSCRRMSFGVVFRLLRALVPGALLPFDMGLSISILPFCYQFLR